MARSTKNRQITPKDNGTHSDFPFEAPVDESANARVQQLGPFRRANLTAGLSATALTVGGVDADAPTLMLAQSPGVLIGLIYQFNANVTAGGAAAAILQPTIAPLGVTPAAAGDVVNVASGGAAAQVGVVDTLKSGIGAEIPFNKGDGLGITVATNGAFAPTTDDLSVYLIVRWAPAPA